ncbi:pyridoxamine 5'-phosphate oxidase family protein [Streptomyces prunicolor]|uniref:pyridoxamine 5'-phosphate oxidase family protein n=1 Tax=Streptomyces prunicolor TaxID=67348 RepID=UPI00224FD98E|nr:pyridoxamine 5'-phosphate oxidase family protein [Streptomyces prunicolor]MCX5239021.1 pyridoxamine 5'-phosphate oxidase family protein [Streptomyces prunicolor]
MTAGIPQRVHMVELGRDEALKLLAEAPLGRVVFSHHALPAIRPVNHLVEANGDIVIRTHTGAALLGRAARSEVVAYEADDLDPATRTGWSVVVTGAAGPVTDPAELTRYRTQLTPWVDTEMEHVVRIHADVVTGYRLVGGDEGS